jgi:competence protein ComEC
VPTVHFLNVGNGDCSIIKHASGRVTVIDVSRASASASLTQGSGLGGLGVARGLGLSGGLAGTVLTRGGAGIGGLSGGLLPGDYGQKASPENPIEYLKRIDVTSIFRFVLTHPDMDHMDGIEDLFREFAPVNFWDSDNTCRKDDWGVGPYKQADWKFYCRLRDTKPQTNPKRLTLYSGDTGVFWNQGENPDGLEILAPTPDLVRFANQSGEFNDASYVLLYRAAGGGRFVFAGDSFNESWDHILRTHRESIKNVDVLVAPHHGRRSGDRDFAFLDVTRPKLTLFGNALSKDLAYRPWYDRNLSIVTNNQAGNVVIDANVAPMRVYASNEEYARDCNSSTYYSAEHFGYFLRTVP